MCSVPLCVLEVLICTELLTGVNIAVIKALSLSKVFKAASAWSLAKPCWRWQELHWWFQKEQQETPSCFFFPSLVPFISSLPPMMDETWGVKEIPGRDSFLHLESCFQTGFFIVCEIKTVAKYHRNTSWMILLMAIWAFKQVLIQSVEPNSSINSMPMLHHILSAHALTLSTGRSEGFAPGIYRQGKFCLKVYLPPRWRDFSSSAAIYILVGHW